MGYNVFVALGLLAGYLVKRSEERRLGYTARPGYGYVGMGALIGAALGAKVGMLLYVSFDDWRTLWTDLFSLHFGGKTVLGGLTGGYLGVEIAKKLARVVGSTGDSFVLAIPIGQAIGRLGCLAAGCCYGIPSTVPWAVFSHGALRHPVQLYDALGCLLLAGVFARLRHRDWPAGYLFRTFLVAYAVLRIVLDPFRGDERMTLGFFSLAQWYCVAAIAVLLVSLRRPDGPPIMA